MPAPLSLDLRIRFRGYIEDGLSGREAARRMRVSAATGARLARKVRRGESLAPAKCGRPPWSGKLGPYREFLLELVGHDPDITLVELQGALAEAEAVRVHHSAIARALRRLGFTYKKSRWSQTNGGDPTLQRRAPSGYAAASPSCARGRSGWCSWMRRR